MAEKASYSARPHLRDPSFCSLAQNLRMKPKKNEKKIAGLGFPLMRLNYTFLTVRAQQSSAQKKYDLHFNFWTFLHLLLYKVFFSHSKRLPVVPNQKLFSENQACFSKSQN